MPATIVVWDNIGNTLFGVRPWASWPARIKERLLDEDPGAEANAPSFAQLFADYDVNLVWPHDPARLGANFDDLARDFAPHLRPLTDPADLAGHVAACDSLVVHKERQAVTALARAERLRLVQHLGQDYRGAPVELLRLRRIPVAVTPLANHPAVAEHVWARILQHAERLPAQRRRMESLAYLDSWGLVPGIANVRDLTLGLFGFGEIACPIARVAHAFEMPGLYWDIERFPAPEAGLGVRYAEWDNLFHQSDVLNVQFAVNERITGTVSAREMTLMKPTALIVDTARGKFIDQAALVAALRELRLGGACPRRL